MNIQNSIGNLIVKALRADTGQLETFVFNGDKVSYDFICRFTAGTWKWYEKITQDINGKEHREKIYIVKNKRNREHEKVYITLQDETTITCPESGISYIARIPTPEHLNLTTIHPLAIYSNVSTVIASYNKNGIKLETELHPQILAGMLITCLRHKDLLFCKDFVQANLFLQRIKPDSLAYAVRFFNSLPSGISLPKIHLNPDDISNSCFHLRFSGLSKEQVIADMAELIIINYIRTCRGDKLDSDYQGVIRVSKERSKKTVRIYTDKVVDEAKKIENTIKRGKGLIEKLEKNTSVSVSTIQVIKLRLNSLMYLTEKARIEVAQLILSSFGQESSAAKELAVLFTSVSTAHLEDDLLTFAQELERDKQDWQTQNKSKMSLIEKLRKASKGN